MSIEHSILDALHGILGFLPAKRQNRFWTILLSMLIVAGLETATAGLIAVYASAIVNPELIIKVHLPRLKQLTQISINLDTDTLILYMSIAVVVALAIKNTCQALTVYASKLYAGSISGFLSQKMLDGFLRLPYEWHLKHNPTDLIQSIQWRIYFNNILTTTMRVISDSLVITLMIASIIAVAPLLSVPVISVLGLTSVVIIRHNRIRLSVAATRGRDYNRAINQQAAKAINGIKDIKIYRQEANFVDHYNRDVTALSRLEAIIQLLRQFPMWILETTGFAMLGTAVCYLYLVSNASNAKITGIISLLAVTAWRVLPAMIRIMEGVGIIRESLPYINTNLDYLKEADDQLKAIKNATKHEHVFSNNIHLEKVSFGYAKSQSPVIQNLSLDIVKGQAIGIIGTSGSGKSTLVDIIIGLLQPQNGCIIVDGKPLQLSHTNSWLNNLGYVSQTPYIFDGSLAENIAFGLHPDEIDRQRINECCLMASMDNFIHQLPDGIDTILGERGVRLSGGQRQRVAIARALYHNPEVLIFDEATSALDDVNERSIQQTISNLSKNMTIIIIAHRLSTVNDCDEIIWIDNGMIKGSGNPSKILKAYNKQIPSNSDYSTAIINNDTTT